MDEYIVREGYSLQILASNNYPELNILVYPNRDDSIVLPKINRIHVKGVTPDELQFSINKAYEEQ